MTTALEVAADGFRLTVRVTPRASRDALEGVGADASGRGFLKVRVRAAPHDGEANAAVLALLSKSLKTPKSALRVVRGASDRVKVVHVADLAALERARDALEARR